MDGGSHRQRQYRLDPLWGLRHTGDRRKTSQFRIVSSIRRIRLYERHNPGKFAFFCYLLTTKIQIHNLLLFIFTLLQIVIIWIITVIATGTYYEGQKGSSVINLI